MKVLGIKQPFYLSGIVHLLFFALIFISYLFNWINKDSEPKILTLVSLPNNKGPLLKSNTKEDQLDYEKMEANPLNFKPQSLVKITPLPRTKDVPNKLVKSSFINPPEKPKISQEEFNEKYGIEKIPASNKKIVKIPSIKINNQHKDVHNQKSKSADQTWNTLRDEYEKKDLYKKQLSQYLYKQWQRFIPMGSSGLFCEVTFKLNRMGRIYALTINASSVNKDFDQSVINMFNSIASFAPPPKSLEREVFFQRFQSL